MSCEQGFSTYTCLPAWQLQMVCRVWEWFGVAMEITSMDLSSRSLRRSEYVAGRFDNLPAASFSTLSSISHRAAISTFGMRPYAFKWSLPRPRNPTQATRTVSLGLGMARRAAASTPAELMRKCLRFMNLTPDRQYSARNRWWGRLLTCVLLTCAPIANRRKGAG